MHLKFVLRISLFVLIFSYLSSCTPNNIETDNSLQKYFDQYHVTGTFGLYSNGQAHFTVYNLKTYTDSVYPPFSTFDIVTSLIGLQTGVITNEKMVMQDATSISDSNITMLRAFKNPGISYYRQVAQKIGKDTMQNWLDSIGYAAKYGRAVINNDIDSFWFDNNFKITPDEQLGLAKKLYFNQLPFQKRAQEIVKNAMLQQDNATYKLSYKIATGFMPNGNAFGWLVGWEEENVHPYFFILQVQGAYNLNLETVQPALLKSILEQYGFFNGKK